MSYQLGNLELSPDQCAILDHVKAHPFQGEGLKIQALAGTGKSTTYRAIVEHCAPEIGRTRYLVFNKSMQVEAQRIFPSWVKVTTAHSAAYGAMIRTDFGRKMKSRNLLRNPTLKEIRQELRLDLLHSTAYLTVGDMANLARENARLWMYSMAGEELMDEFVDKRDLLDRIRSGQRRAEKAADQHLVTWDDSENREAAAQDIMQGILRSGEISNNATELWKAMSSSKNDFPAPHDVYLKLFQTSGRGIPSIDTLMIDEAQDLNSVLIGVVDNCRAHNPGLKVFWVGDSRQQIYEWRGAVDAIALAEEHEMPLETSFRFGSDIADVANVLLDTLGCPYKLIGKGPGKVDFNVDAPFTLLARTNMTLFREALALAERDIKFYVVGGVRPVLLLVEAVLDLQEGRYVSHPLVALYDSVDEIEDDDGADPELKRAVKLIDEYKEDIRAVIKSIEGCCVSEREAHVVLCTGHKSKGSQWDQVVLSGDFLEVGNEAGDEIKLDAADYRLLYVCVTRAKRALRVDSKLADKLDLPSWVKE